MSKLRVYFLSNRVPFRPSRKSCGLKNVMKLRSCRANFKITLLERPPEKSCSTSQFFMEISCKIFSLTKFKNHHAQLQIDNGILYNSKIS